MNGWNILIADNDPDFCISTARELENTGLFGHIYTTDRMEEAMEHIRSHDIRILITDFLIRKGDVVHLNRELKQARQDAYLVICSMLLQTGLLKPGALNEADLLISRPCTAAHIAQEVLELQHGGRKASDYPRDMETEIAALLRSCNISTKAAGYRYLKQAVIIASQTPTGTDGITKVIYPEIARMYHTEYKNVERGIRYLISSTWKRSRGETWGRFLTQGQLEREKAPTNAEVVSAIAEYCRLGWTYLQARE